MDYVIGREKTTVQKVVWDDIISRLCDSCDYFAGLSLNSLNWHKAIKFNHNF